MDLDSIKDSLRPDKKIIGKADSFVSEVNKRIKSKGVKAVCVKGGSIAKGTFIKDDFDVDLFVKFDYSYKDKNLSDILESVISDLKYERVHGSRDYFLISKDLNYEIVPVLDIADPERAENVTDMSPLHVRWVKNNLKEGQDDDIRLLKKFCKTCGVYGAESYIKGFSGHVIDILVIYYGSFENVLRKSGKWQPKVIIDTEGYYKSKRQILFDMNTSKIKGPMIVVDPIMKERNAASALSYGKFIRFKKAASEFLKNPSQKFFEEKKIGKTFLKRKFKKNLYILTLRAPDGKRDVVGSKVLKAFKFMKSNLKKRGFNIKESGWTWNEKHRALFWFVFEEKILPSQKTVEGPPLDMEEHVANFKKKYDETFEREGKIYAKIDIVKRTPEENIKDISGEKYFREKLNFRKVE